jgi:hypothetical protein
MSRYGLRVKGRHYGVLLLAFTVFMTPSFAAAAEEGTFTGTWIASGKRQSQDFAEGRAVFTYSVKGHVNLKNGRGNDDRPGGRLGLFNCPDGDLDRLKRLDHTTGKACALFFAIMLSIYFPKEKLP